MFFNSKFILLRHGQPNLFEGPWIQPKSNPLSGEGIRQVSKISELLRNHHVNVIYSSPYRRALQSAEIIGKELDLIVNVDHDLKERSQGELENRQLSEEQINRLWERFKEFKKLTTQQQWTTKPFVGFETDQELLDRSVKCLTEISQENMEKTVLVVTHASLIKVLLIHFGTVKLEERDYFKIKPVDYFEV